MTIGPEIIQKENAMPVSAITLFAGLILGIAAVIDGWEGFFITFVIGGVAWLLGAGLSGELNLSSLFRGRPRG